MISASSFQKGGTCDDEINVQLIQKNFPKTWISCLSMGGFLYFQTHCNDPISCFSLHALHSNSINKGENHEGNTQHNTK